ncbi:MAG: hypothetical protein ABW352_02225 [Polyangiales bacterium]
MSGWGRWWLLGALLLGLGLAWRIVPYQVDDAFITYRYAQNLLAGEPLRFNLGGERVEGFSSPLWMLAMAAVGSVGAIPVGGVVLGLGAYLATAYVLLRAAGFAAAVAWLCLPTAIFYAVTGLETCAFALCVALFSASLAGQLPRSYGLAAAVIAPWVRPEAPWLVVSGLCLNRREWRPSAALVGSYAVLIATRWTLFHELLPNTYFAKPRDDAQAWQALTSAFSAPWPWLLFAAASVAATRAASARGYLLASLSWLLAFWLEGGDWMPQARMMLPAFTLATLACGELARMPRALVLVALTMVASVASTLEQARRSERSLHSIRREARKVAGMIEQSGAHSVAAVDIGELGFASRIQILDLVGLTDRRIAHSPGLHGSKQLDLAYVFEERRPDLILIRMNQAEIRPEQDVIRLPPSDAMGLIEARLLLDPRLRERYQLALLQYPQVPRSNMYIRALYRRKDFRASGALSGPLTLLRTRPVD